LIALTKRVQPRMDVRLYLLDIMSAIDCPPGIIPLDHDNRTRIIFDDDIKILLVDPILYKDVSLVAIFDTDYELNIADIPQNFIYSEADLRTPLPVDLQSPTVVPNQYATGTRSTDVVEPEPGRRSSFPLTQRRIPDFWTSGPMNQENLQFETLVRDSSSLARRYNDYRACITSWSASAADEQNWENAKGETVVTDMINYLYENPKPTYRALLSDLARAATRNGKDRAEAWRSAGLTETVVFQHPQLSSLKKLDLDDRVTFLSHVPREGSSNGHGKSTEMSETS